MPHPIRRRPRHRQRRGRAVAQHLDAVDDALARQPESFADRARDPRVRLVVHEQVDLLDRQSRLVERLQRRLAHPADRVAEHLRTVHHDLAIRKRRVQRPRVRSVGAEHDRPDRAVTGITSDRADHRRAGRVAEQRRALAVLVVRDPRDEVRADEQHPIRAPGLDLSGR
jgi:hypothetical protein